MRSVIKSIHSRLELLLRSIKFEFGGLRLPKVAERKDIRKKMLGFNNKRKIKHKV